MSVRETSLAAYNELRDNGLLTQRQREVMLCVYRCFYGRDFTRKELSEALKWPINCLTGRVLELIELGFLEETGARRDKSAICRIKPAQAELDLAA